MADDYSLQDCEDSPMADDLALRLEEELDAISECGSDVADLLVFDRTSKDNEDEIEEWKEYEASSANIFAQYDQVVHHSVVSESAPEKSDSPRMFTMMQFKNCEFPEIVITESDRLEIQLQAQEPQLFSFQASLLFQFELNLSLFANFIVL